MDTSNSDLTELCSAGKAAELIVCECERIRDMLLEKNKSYGNSAFAPVGVFSKAGPEERMAVRLDDKIARIMKGGEFPGDDTELDIIGYLILRRIARGLQQKKNDAKQEA